MRLLLLPVVRLVSATRSTEVFGTRLIFTLVWCWLVDLLIDHLLIRGFFVDVCVCACAVAGLNGSETFAHALADIVKTHLDRGENFSPQYRNKCLTCTKPLCRQILNPAF